VESRRDRDKKGTAQGHRRLESARTLYLGIAGHLVTVTADDAPAVLGDDSSGEANKALNELCEAGCDRLVLLYILKVIRQRLPCDWWVREESKQEAKRRRGHAAVLDRAASIIKERYAFFLPRENMTPEDAQNLRGWDQLSIMQGSVSHVRLLLGIESVADELRSPDAFRVAAALRTNQDDFDVISRCVFCSYVQRTTRDWHDREAAILLSQVGNHKQDRRNATLDAAGLQRWRTNNLDRLLPLSTWAVDRLVAFAPSDPQSPSAN
jgi:hypothetical protein